jgi:uncharacterized protein
LSFLDLASQNLLSPMVLFFALGLMAALGRSDLTIPEAVAKTLALYLMMAIGFKGGAEVAKSGVTATMLQVMFVGTVLSFIIPVIGFFALRAVSKLSAVDAAAVAAHYGSISIVTFVAGTEAVRGQGLPFEGYMVAVAAVMETPAILSALLLAKRARGPDEPAREGESTAELLREVGLNASVVMLVGSFLIGWATGEKGLAMIAPFIIDPFRGVLCLFLLDMGLVAGRGMREGRKHLSPPVLTFGIVMPLVSALMAAAAIAPLGLSVGSAALFITLTASASYIAVPAAMRLALPEAKPAIYLTLSLGVTFPFNLALGIPLYLALAQRVGVGG